VGRNIVAVVWLGGIVLAVGLYPIGAGAFINACLAALAQAGWAIANSIAFLSAQTFDLVRVAAIALFVVFLVLGALAKQRGLGAGQRAGRADGTVRRPNRAGRIPVPLLLVRGSAGSWSWSCGHDPAAARATSARALAVRYLLARGPISVAALTASADRHDRAEAGRRGPAR
jgi:hypothetical protein